MSLLRAIYVGLVIAVLALAQVPGSAEFTAGYQALSKKDYDSAIAAFRAGLEKQPGKAAIHKDLGYTLLKTGENAAARDEFEAALNFNRKDEQAALEYAFLAYETGQPVQARRTFDALRRSGSPATRSLAEQAFQHVDAPLADAIARWQGVLALTDSPAAHCELARLAELRDDAPLASGQGKLCPVKPQAVPENTGEEKTAGKTVEGARGSDLWAFFDSAYRIRADVDYLAQRWSDAGISVLYVASWHNMEPDAATDQYLKALIDASHRHGIVVYAWLELPYVSEKFWADHPNWRDKTALEQDAQIGWRKLMNLQNPECSRAVAGLVKGLMDRFDWDGINLAELSFESLDGAADPARFTPMNENVRSEFKEIADFDPMLLFDAKSPHDNKKELDTFLSFRTVLASRMQSEWLKNLEAIRKTKPYLDLVLTRRDDHSDLIIESTNGKKLGVDLSAVDLTRTKLLNSIGAAARSSLGIALYSENAINPADLPVIGAAAASNVRLTREASGKTIIDSTGRTRLDWSGPAALDGQPWPIRSSRSLFVPAGHHIISADSVPSPFTITEFNADLQSATVSKTEVDIAYQSHTRAPVAFDENVTSIEVDGAPFWKAAGNECSGWAMLPAGQHLVAFIRR